MSSVAAAIAWDFRRRHRWGVVALICYFALLGATRIALLVNGGVVHFGDDLAFAFTVAVPTAATFLYLIAVFTFGLAGDVAARESMYPSRMFTLPVTTTALVAWPMLFGGASVALLWALTRLLGFWPADLRVPIIWPAVFGAALIAWAQALTWLPYPMRGLRIVVSVLLLMMIDVVVFGAMAFRPGEGVMVALLAPHLPLAYVTARSAVARARCGEVPEWSTVLSPLVRLTGVMQRRSRPFKDSVSAQTWLESRIHGRSLPLMVAIVVPCELGLLFIFRDTPAIVIETLLLALLTPAFMAAFVAASVGKSAGANDFTPLGLTSFIATRPLSNTALIVAKLKATVKSTLVAWSVMAIVIPLAVAASGTMSTVRATGADLAEVFGVARAVAVTVLIVLGCILLTWKQLVQSLYVGVSGREWAMKAYAFGMLAVVTAVLPVLRWFHFHPAAATAAWYSFPWLAALLICVRLALAIWIVARLNARRLVSPRTLLLLVAAWNVAVFSLYAALVAIFPDVVIRHYVLALIAVLAVPITRLLAAPLAVAWSRNG